MSSGRIVVVGNGIAGLTAADSLRSHGHDGELTVIGDEPHPAYSRPALSKALLRDEHDLTSHRLPAATHEATELLGVRAIGLDLERGLVRLDDGERVPFDGLVIASGCRARRLGPVGSSELTLRGLDDALVLREHIVDRPTVVVLGGGPLGMEIASGCLAAGCEVTLVSKGAPLRAQLGEYLSGIAVSAAGRHGLRIVNTRRATVAGRDGHAVVELAEGGRVEADLGVTAAGDMPNVEWLEASGLPGNGPLKVDGRGRLSPHVVAAGDVAAIPIKGGARRIPQWNSAIAQSKVAAAALLHGDDAPALDFQPYFWTEQFGLSVKVIGDLPLTGVPTVVDGDPGTESALLRWEYPDRAAAVAAVNYRIAIPRLRRMCTPAA